MTEEELIRQHTSGWRRGRVPLQPIKWNEREWRAIKEMLDEGVRLSQLPPRQTPAEELAAKYQAHAAFNARLKANPDPGHTSALPGRQRVLTAAEKWQRCIDEANGER